jgi:hypothetical protein
VRLSFPRCDSRKSDSPHSLCRTLRASELRPGPGPSCTTPHRAAAQELIVLLIDQNPHRELVDGRHLNRLRACDLDAREAPAADIAAIAADDFRKSRRRSEVVMCKLQ